MFPLPRLERQTSTNRPIHNNHHHHHRRQQYNGCVWVLQRVQFKMATLVYRSLTGTAPAYLSDDCRLTSPVGARSLRTGDSRTCVPRRAHNFGARCFATAGPDQTFCLLVLNFIEDVSVWVTEIAALCDWSLKAPYINTLTYFTYFLQQRRRQNCLRSPRQYSDIIAGVDFVPFVIETSGVWGEHAGNKLGKEAWTTDGGSQQGATLYDVSVSAPVGRCAAQKHCLYFRNIASSGRQIPWQAGKCMTWDVTVTDTLAESYIQATSSTAAPRLRA